MKKLALISISMEIRQEENRERQNIECKVSRLVISTYLFEKSRMQGKPITSETPSLKPPMSIKDFSGALLKRIGVSLSTEKYNYECRKHSEKRIIWLGYFDAEFIIEKVILEEGLFSFLFAISMGGFSRKLNEKCVKVLIFKYQKQTSISQLFDYLKKDKDTSRRRAKILKIENNDRIHLALIKNFLKVKCGLKEEVTNINDEIAKLKPHSKLVMKGSFGLFDEAVRCYIYNKCIFGCRNVCQRCNQSRKTVDYLSTRYQKRHEHDYKCINLFPINRYEFLFSNRIRSHYVPEILDDKYIEIQSDIFNLNKRQDKIDLIEVGKNSQDSLQITYDLLANDLGLI
ncbi:hypothetical protein CWI38_0289p0020 [Hamiltosporidium tvaerminnensis]|uniref:Uncharacterized protein n=1 Tax=Hamiltosporidium tvaerminnensis TaxID=1176355 RepID=A0A4Q9M044_9MICR|nr:hypothetical protein CWI38_0289p0020 [Hamiltosporidium tvaerminnensis]